MASTAGPAPTPMTGPAPAPAPGAAPTATAAVPLPVTKKGDRHQLVGNDLASHRFVIEKELAPGVYLARDKKDNVEYLARDVSNTSIMGDLIAVNPPDPLLGLLSDTGGESVVELLNHENLVSFLGQVVRADVVPRRTWKVPIYGQDDSQEEAPGQVQTTYHIFDFCEAGTLHNLLEEPPCPARPDGYFPEPLVWHVLVSVTRALAYLHTGMRDRPVVRDDVTRVTGPREFYDWYADPDWHPVLHRGIHPRVIYFKHPRGNEGLGLCKLGDFRKAYISGTYIDPHDGKEGDNAHPITIVPRSRFGSGANIAKLYEVYQTRSNFMLRKDDRIYTPAHELAELGGIILHMMCGTAVPSREECDLCDCLHTVRTLRLTLPADEAEWSEANLRRAHVESGRDDDADFTFEMGPKCQHGCWAKHFDADKLLHNLSSYSHGLRKCARRLYQMDIELNRCTDDVYRAVRAAYEDWRATDEDEGRYWIDYWDERQRLHTETLAAIPPGASGPILVE